MFFHFQIKIIHFAIADRNKESYHKDKFTALTTVTSTADSEVAWVDVFRKPGVSLQQQEQKQAADMSYIHILSSLEDLVLHNALSF